MSQHSILGKLDNMIDEVTTERDVVYALVEIRKYLEQGGLRATYPALDFYCSFALHTKMDRTGAAQILRRFDEAWPYLAADQELPQRLMQEFDRTVTMQAFRRELEAFLTANGLSPAVTHRDWARFLHLYSGVIDECSLEVKSQKVRLTNITRVTVHLEHPTQPLPPGAKDDVRFRIVWRSFDKQGRPEDFVVVYSYRQSEAARVWTD